jgi:hypothetical protein
VDLSFTDEDRAFRRDVRAWLRDNIPTSERPEQFEGARDWNMAWQRRQFEGGYGGITWPREYGGQGLPLARQLIWFEEYAKAQGPDIGDMATNALAADNVTFFAALTEITNAPDPGYHALAAGAYCRRASFANARVNIQTMGQWDSLSKTVPTASSSEPTFYAPPKRSSAQRHCWADLAATRQVRKHDDGRVED